MLQPSTFVKVAFNYGRKRFPPFPQVGKRTLPSRSCIALQINSRVPEGSAHYVIFNRRNLTRQHVSTELLLYSITPFLCSRVSYLIRCVDHRPNTLTVINTQTGFNFRTSTQTICTRDWVMTQQKHALVALVPATAVSTP